MRQCSRASDHAHEHRTTTNRTANCRSCTAARRAVNKLGVLALKSEKPLRDAEGFDGTRRVA
ncbi:MAG TPA: hypothetical protein VHV51_15680 [Polyangiaceae bacterium]|jgi:hypothetical protein|nr:hypothetical protein [Polyangiaceae bacterium]